MIMRFRVLSFRGIRQSQRARINHRQTGLLVQARRVEHLQVGNGAIRILFAGQFETARGGRGRTGLRGKTLGIQLNRAQAVGDILEGGQHG